MQAFNAWLHVPQPKLQVIGRVIAMLHNASLLCAVLPFSEASRNYGSDRIDDIEDNSQLRRGRPGTSSPIHPVMSRLILCYSFVKVAHKIYGVPQTINSANYVYFLAFQEILALKAQGNRSNDSRNRLYSESDMDQIVTS